MTDRFDLTGQVAIITGASSGIGVALAKAFAEQGADVAIFARRVEKLEKVAEEIKAMGRNVIPVGCDVGNEDQVKAGVTKVIEKFGKVDILVNNAGIALPGSVEELSTEDWEKTMDVNIKGIYLMSKYVVPDMKKRQYGRIINTASVNAIVGGKVAPRHAYNASKAAVLGITTGMGTSLVQHGITVNAIGPGLFKTEMTEDALFEDKVLAYYNQLCPAGRPGELDEITGIAIYFASKAASYTTAQVVYVDGGWTAV